MTVSCPVPDGQIGVVLRLSDFLNCQARALGENGFQALAGGPVVAGMLLGLVTIFVALIGYRFILGSVPTLRDGVGWAVRLGMVLTLATGWPAFETVIYRIAVDAPDELAAILLPVAGLPTDGLDGRVQQAYDAIRLGSAGQAIIVAPTTADNPTSATSLDGRAGTSGQNIPATAQISSVGLFGQPGRPQTASWFAATTLGVTGALRLAIGFLLAIGPIPIMALLFEATLGLFVGWLRALVGAALATLAGVLVTALDLVMVESELAHLQTIERGVSMLDPQALTTIVIAFTGVMLAAIWAATRMAGGLRLSFASAALPDNTEMRGITGMQDLAPIGALLRNAGAGDNVVVGSPRTQAVADALSTAVHREERAIGAIDRIVAPDRTSVMTGASREPVPVAPTGLGTAGRRSSLRRARSIARRDGIS